MEAFIMGILLFVVIIAAFLLMIGVGIGRSYDRLGEILAELKKLNKKK